MKRSQRNALDILFLSPWIAAQRLEQLPRDLCGIESVLAWQRLVMEKWWSAWESGAAGLGAMVTALPGTASPDHVASAMVAPVARRVRANARTLAKKRRR